MNWDFISNLINESEGHPYIVKVLLGESGTFAVNTQGITSHGIARRHIGSPFLKCTFDAVSPGTAKFFLRWPDGEAWSQSSQSKP